MAIDEFGTQAGQMRGLLGNLGVTDDDYRRAKAAKARQEEESLLAQAPQHYAQAIKEDKGTFGLLKDAFFGEMKGPLAALFAPDYVERKTQYALDLKDYSEQRKAEAERGRFGALNAGLRDAWATEDTADDLQAVMDARTGGMDLSDIKHYQKMMGQAFLDPSWETKFDNGVLVRYDKNSDAPAQAVLSDDGSPITEKMDGDLRKTSGWFKRAVPALENMHKLEDRGVTLDREVLTLMQQAQDADGIFQPQIYNKLINDLGMTKDEKQYLRTAQDLAMIQLRKESGAAIGVQEMFNELSQNVMLSDMSDEGYEYQRGTRGRKYRALSDGMPSYLIDEFKADGYFDTLDGLRKGGARVPQRKPPELLDRNTRGNQAAPSVGAEKDGYIFNGGDPADPANWSVK